MSELQPTQARDDSTASEPFRPEPDHPEPAIGEPPAVEADVVEPPAIEADVAASDVVRDDVAEPDLVEDDVTPSHAANTDIEDATSGVAAVDAVLGSLQGLSDRPPEEHVAVFEQAHERLRQALDDDPDALAESNS